jgi:hypothetical protein
MNHDSTLCSRIIWALVYGLRNISSTKPNKRGIHFETIWKSNFKRSTLIGMCFNPMVSFAFKWWLVVRCVKWPKQYCWTLTTGWTFPCLTEKRLMHTRPPLPRMPHFGRGNSRWRELYEVSQVIRVTFFQGIKREAQYLKILILTAFLYY